MIAALTGWLRRRPAPAHETVLRRALAAEAERTQPMPGLPAIQTRTSKNGAPAATGTPPTSADHLEGTPAMTIISRHARELHAGDVIVHDPDHDRPVRWRVSRPPVRTRDGEYAVTAAVDLADGSVRYLYYPALQDLSVEPVGGAA